ncbi:glycohydrolase toxin TNT-related protein [Porticoccus sp. W117]|uniref:glycohydrolase toxin TNT-related protein n=1 Tax=Porticoccus sp. W117 TaxID=3054777 RepID=UPI002596D3F7|nr:glycohydrolase toxin TNT-related protein [Porticoccus sp. W117]MDM3871862.1 glycohydrolase toxin TNT-related protein [Porticoccus sp. W117]
MAFEPFGSRKDSDWTKKIDSSELNSLLTDNVAFHVNLFPYLSNGDPIPASVDHKVARGFTGHEHLDKTGFIHMNGRVYDPELGRFVSPDPIVQAPSNSQSWNRYTYTFNSPLSFTDPSGYSSDLPPGWDGEIHDIGDEFIADDCPPGFICLNLRHEIEGLLRTLRHIRPCPYGLVQDRFGWCSPQPNPNPSTPYGGVLVFSSSSGSGYPDGNQGSSSGGDSQVSAGSSADVRSEAFAAATLAQEEERGFFAGLLYDLFVFNTSGPFPSGLGFACHPNCSTGELTLSGAATVLPFLRTSRVSTVAGTTGTSSSRALALYYPINNGFLGRTAPVLLRPGQVIDRYGGSSISRFFSPSGVPGPLRALPPGTSGQPLRNFEVLRPFVVEGGTVAPAFNQIGLGIQYRSTRTLGELLEQGFLREIF